MAQVSGVVQKIAPKQFNGKTFYSFALSGQEGWFGTGVKKPPTEGTSVRFVERTNARGYKEVDGSIEILADGQAATTVTVAAVATQAAKAGGGSQSAYWDRKEARDISNDSARELGATRNTVLQMMDLMFKQEVIVLPAAKAKKEEAFFAIFEMYTKKLLGRAPDVAEAEEKVVNVEGVSAQSDENWS
jgi:hypothetical protein